MYPLRTLLPMQLTTPTPSRFTLYLASPNAVSHCLIVGVLFLITNYQNVLYRANPENLDLFTYPFAVKVFLAHLDSLFFGFATAIIIFQSQSERLKIFYCSLEAVMIFLNFNRNYISEFLGINANFFLGSFLALFSGVTLYYLGTIAKQHLHAYLPPLPFEPQLQSLGVPENEEREEAIAIGELMNEVDNMAYLKKHSKIVTDLESGQSIGQTAKRNKVSKSTVQNVKRLLIHAKKVVLA